MLRQSAPHFSCSRSAQPSRCARRLQLCRPWATPFSTRRPTVDHVLRGPRPHPRLPPVAATPPVATDAVWTTVSAAAQGVTSVALSAAPLLQNPVLVLIIALTLITVVPPLFKAVSGIFRWLAAALLLWLAVVHPAEALALAQGALLWVSQNALLSSVVIIAVTAALLLPYAVLGVILFAAAAWLLGVALPANAAWGLMQSSSSSSSSSPAAAMGTAIAAPWVAASASSPAVMQEAASAAWAHCLRLAAHASGAPPLV